MNCILMSVHVGWCTGLSPYLFCIVEAVGIFLRGTCWEGQPKVAIQIGMKRVKREDQMKDLINCKYFARMRWQLTLCITLQNAVSSILFWKMFANLTSVEINSAKAASLLWCDEIFLLWTSNKSRTHIPTLAVAVDCGAHLLLSYRFQNICTRKDEGGVGWYVRINLFVHVLVLRLHLLGLYQFT